MIGNLLEVSNMQKRKTITCLSLSVPAILPSYYTYSKLITIRYLVNVMKIIEHRDVGFTTANLQLKLHQFPILHR